METKNLILRLPAELHKRLKEMAHAQNRSLNGQIVQILQEAQKTDQDRKQSDR